MKEKEISSDALVTLWVALNTERLENERRLCMIPPSISGVTRDYFFNPAKSNLYAAITEELTARAVDAKNARSAVP